MKKNTGKWICEVCGYVHQGAEPPEYCPVCGATADYFEPYEEPAAAAPGTGPDRWRCLNCEYIHEETEPPGFCPVCGVPAERFEPYEEAPSAGVSSREKQVIAIVGAGIAGISAVEAVRQTSSGAEILLLSKEAELPYFRLNLTRYLAGEIEAGDLPIHPEGWYKEKGIQLIRPVELCKIETDKKILELRGTGPVRYDKLILTMGSHPFVPPLPGVNKENVTPLRTIKDADFILEQTGNNIRCVVLGGGILGLETAGALSRRGNDVTILEGYSWLLPRQLNEKGGIILEDYVRRLGIKTHKNARVKEITGDERVRGVLLESRETIHCELVIITTGVRSNSYIARMAGFDVNRGIVVNNFLETSAPGIYAAGDVAEHHGVNYGTWGPSQFQGTMAGMNAAGKKTEFSGIPRSNMLKVLGYDLYSMGRIDAEDASYRFIDGAVENRYYYFMFRDNRLLGFILLGDTSLSARAKTIVENGVDCSSLLQKSPSVDSILDFLRR
ncbi:MAG: FAD-dependent oxidoreductase [Candidatus Aminicenantes bacterium]|nr:FAD-dependent oxidoreductase [Candidatus Aminicenantes bacterium]